MFFAIVTADPVVRRSTAEEAARWRQPDCRCLIRWQGVMSPPTGKRRASGLRWLVWIRRASAGARWLSSWRPGERQATEDRGVSHRCGEATMTMTVLATSSARRPTQIAVRHNRHRAAAPAAALYRTRGEVRSASPRTKERSDQHNIDVAYERDGESDCTTIEVVVRRPAKKLDKQPRCCQECSRLASKRYGAFVGAILLGPLRVHGYQHVNA